MISFFKKKIAFVEIKHIFAAAYLKFADADSASSGDSNLLQSLSCNESTNAVCALQASSGFASCKWGFCAKMFAIQRYWGSFHSYVRSRTDVNAESKRVKMRFAGGILRNKCVIDSSLAFFDLWIAIPRWQRNCNRGCTASCLTFKAKKIKLAVAKQTLDSAENHIPNANNTSTKIYFMCFIKCQI